MKTGMNKLPQAGATADKNYRMKDDDGMPIRHIG